MTNFERLIKISGMRKIAFTLLIFLNMGLVANPIVIVAPVISEFYYNQGNWQIELCVKSDIYGWMKIQSFDELSVVSDAGQVPIQTFIQFYYDSVFVIDQSWLSSTFIINPIHDNLNIIYDGWSMWHGISYAPSPDTLVVSSPGENESIAVHYLSGGYQAYTMKQSPPTIGYSVFEVTSRSGISGFVYDQFQIPVPDVTLKYYPSLEGKFPQPLISIVTDSNGYFESNEMYPMGYYVELSLNNFVLKTDMVYFEPDSSYYKEYNLTNVGLATLDPYKDIDLTAAPNPFTSKTSFHANITEHLQWKDARIIIRNMNGQQVDFIPMTENPWAKGVISVDWSPGTIPGGLYIYSLVVDGQAVKSGKLIAY